MCNFRICAAKAVFPSSGTSIAPTINDDVD